MNSYEGKTEMPRIIALCGLKRSGKDTVADILCDKYGYKNIKVAEGLKEMIKVAFTFTDEQLESDIKDEVDKRWGVTPRQVMQFMGTDVMQFQIQKLLPNVGRSFWIQKLITTHIDANPLQKYVISDMRFRHEYDMLSPYKPYVIRIERDSLSERSTDHHLSETSLDSIPCNEVFKNNGTISDIQTYVHRLISQI